MKKHMVLGLVGFGLFLAGCTEKPSGSVDSSTKEKRAYTIFFHCRIF